VVAAALTLALARAGRPVVAADFAGDLATALGVPEVTGPGLRDWLDAGEGVPVDALGRLARTSSHGITLIGEGAWQSGVGAHDHAAGRRLVAALRDLRAGGPVVADCGRVEATALRSFVGAADRSLLVLRPCYLSLRRAVAAPRPTAVVIVHEPVSRKLRARDVSDALGVPVAAEIGWDGSIAEAVDTGLLAARVPKRLVSALREVAA
jgi:hypothetical protein